MVVQRKRVLIAKLLPICEKLSEPKHITEKFNLDNVENFSDPITKPKVRTVKIDYSSDPWYQHLNEQLGKLKEQGMEKRKEIEELRNPKPLSPLKKVNKENICKYLKCTILSHKLIFWYATSGLR